MAKRTKGERLDVATVRLGLAERAWLEDFAASRSAREARHVSVSESIRILVRWAAALDLATVEAKAVGGWRPLSQREEEP